MSAPCYRCGDRQIGCHSKCKKYEEYRQGLLKLQKRNDVDRMCKEILCEAAKTSKRNARNGHDAKNVRGYRGQG